MVGAFKMPSLVYMNISVLKTLEDRHFFAGFAEIMKAALIRDGILYEWLLEMMYEICEKEPTTYIEGGHFILNFEKPFEEIIVQKSGIEINPDTDVVLGANRGLFAVDEYVKVNGIKVNPMHTPLVSFGESKIYRCCCGDYKQSKTPKVVFNLFNNMWGTGNPQWITGSYKFDFCLT